MPAGARRITRTVRTTPVAPPVVSSFEPCAQRYAPLGATVPTLPALEQPAAPKHFPFPNTPIEDDIFFEFLMCFFSIFSAGLQYVHLYRSVWWLPHSYTESSFELLFNRLAPDNYILEKGEDDEHFYFRAVFFGGICLLLSICAIFVMQNHPVVNILYLCYPGFIALSIHMLPLRYCDILHRSALHLGMWEKLETGRTMLLVNNTWKEDLLWPYGALVRYGRDIWRAHGDCNSIYFQESNLSAQSPLPSSRPNGCISVSPVDAQHALV
ncbi:hypothetical protein NQ314_006133 [Rhamnusium bicolor]|uniref:Uncharacterized protein n=1 Tax=Rhamnusium bicolor TaxID=1586634 RepID=A0AAV8Z6Z9_9CUCU|nr:hypothetical protein NQ314_006133 [Rhamnusium bicolor]